MMADRTVPVHSANAPSGLRATLILLALLAGTLFSEGILESWAADPDLEAQATPPVYRVSSSGKSLSSSTPVGVTR